MPYRLESLLPLEGIKTVNVGGFGARRTALLTGAVEATSLLDPQISMADQLGLWRVIGNRFNTLWVVPPTTDRALVDTYFRVLERAILAEFQDRLWDFMSFDPGECFFYAQLEREEFDEILEAAKSWGLDDYMQSRSFDDLALTVTI